MDILGKIIGFILFIVAAAGAVYLMKGKGRLKKLTTWSKLEATYRTDAMPDSYTLTSGLVGLGEYRNTLQIALTDQGVYLNLPAITRLGSKPVRIPYADFVLPETDQTVSQNMFDYTQFLVRGEPVCLAIPMAQKIIDRQRHIRSR